MLKYFLLVFFLLNPLSDLHADKVKTKQEPPIKTSRANLASIAWTQTLKSGGSKKKYFPETASPYAEDNKVFVGTHSSLFYAFDASNGSSLWTFTSNGPIASQAIVAGTTVYFGNNEGTLYALDKNTGEKIWDYFAGAEILAQPSIKEDTIFIVTTSREVFSIDRNTGILKWRQKVRGFDKKITMRGNAPIVVDGDELYLAFADGQVAALSQEDGLLLWMLNFSVGRPAFKDVDAKVLIDDDELYIVGYYGSLVKINKKNGKVLWKKDIKSGNNLAQNKDYIFVSSEKGEVKAIRKSDGIRRWDVQLNAGLLTAPIIISNKLIVGTQKNLIYILDLKSGKALQNLPISSGAYSAPFKSGNKVFFLSGSAKLLSLIISD